MISNIMIFGGLASALILNGLKYLVKMSYYREPSKNKQEAHNNLISFQLSALAVSSFGGAIAMVDLMVQISEVLR